MRRLLFLDTGAPVLKALVETRADGTLILRSANPLPDMAPTSSAEFLSLRAERRGSSPAAVRAVPFYAAE